MTTKPFSMYPEDHAKLLALADKVLCCADPEDREEAAILLADIVQATLRDEEHYEPEPAAPDLLSALKISLDEHYATWMAARAEVEGSRMSKQLFDMEPGVIAARAAIKRATEG